MYGLQMIQAMNRNIVVQSEALKAYLPFHGADTTATYRSLMEALKTRQTKKLLNHTYAVRRDLGKIAVRLHNTDVLTFHPNGDVQINSGGWRTVTTKSRLNRYLPSPLRVSAKKFVWYLFDGKKEIEFEDGLVLCPKSW